jgi:hypothetical protein
MGEAIAKRVFAVNYSQLDRWSVAYFRSVNWQWPKEFIRPIGEALCRIQKIVTADLVTTPIIEKISFGGEITLLNEEKRAGYKGRLFKAESGQLIYSKIRVKQGSLCIVPPSIDWVAVSSEYPVYEINPKIAKPIYLELVLRSSAFKHYLDGLSHGGSTKTRIHPDQFEDLLIPIPPLSIQQKIVAHWEAAQLELASAETALSALVSELHYWLVNKSNGFGKVTQSKVFIANYENTQQWDVKAGRAAAFSTSNPDFIRLGDYTEECTETVRPWEEPEKEWPIYGVNNKDGVFLSAMQMGKEFNAPYKKIERDWFFHNPTRANVGSLGIVPEVPPDAITSPEYQVWRLKNGFLPDFMALMLKTDYFLALVGFNRVGGVKQRMYYANLAEIRLSEISIDMQKDFTERRQEILENIKVANEQLALRRKEIEKMILGTIPVEGN